jgi:hypothetical protein
MPEESYILHLLKAHYAYQFRCLLIAPEDDTLIDFVL